jgi:hypothetical protein
MSWGREVSRSQLLARTLASRAFDYLSMRISLLIPPLISTQGENSPKHEPFNQPPDLFTDTDKTRRILTAEGSGN